MHIDVTSCADALSCADIMRTALAEVLVHRIGPRVIILDDFQLIKLTTSLWWWRSHYLSG